MSKEKLQSLTKQEFNKLTDKYTDKKIGEMFELSKNYVGYWRRRIGVQSYGSKNNIVVGVKGVSNTSNRKIFFNERFFQSIDSEAKAYALGLMLTDGHLTKEMHRARISLTESDAYILSNIASYMDFEGDIIVTKPSKDNYQVHNMHSLNLNSTMLCQDLVNLGLSSSKDNLLTLPNIPLKLQRHMLRGMWDGDGYISKSECTFELSGRKELLESVVSCFVKNGLETNPNIQKQKTIYRLRLYSIKHMDLIYKDSNPKLRLVRKFERYSLLKALSQS